MKWSNSERHDPLGMGLERNGIIEGRGGRLMEFKYLGSNIRAGCEMEAKGEP